MPEPTPNHMPGKEPDCFNHLGENCPNCEAPSLPGKEVAEANRVLLHRAKAMDGPVPRTGDWSTDEDAVAPLGEEVQSEQFVALSEHKALTAVEQTRAEKAEADAERFEKERDRAIETRENAIQASVREQLRAERFEGQLREVRELVDLLRDRMPNAPSVFSVLDDLDAALSSSPSVGAVPEIPREYWREVPCGHPAEPVAMYNAERWPVCHCGQLLDTAGLLPAPPEAPGPLSHCQKCGCHVAIPPHPSTQPVSTQDKEEKSSGVSGEAISVAQWAITSDAALERLTDRYHGQAPIDESFGDEEREDTVARREAGKRARADLQHLASRLSSETASTQPKEVPGEECERCKGERWIEDAVGGDLIGMELAPCPVCNPGGKAARGTGKKPPEVVGEADCSCEKEPHPELEGSPVEVRPMPDCPVHGNPNFFAGGAPNGFRAFEEELQRLAAGAGRCPNYDEATEQCDCIVCRTRTLLTEWEDHPLFASLTQPAVSEVPGDADTDEPDLSPPTLRMLVDAAISQCRSIEDECETEEGLPNALAGARGEVSVALLIRELLEEPTREVPGNSGGVEEGIRVEDRGGPAKVADNHGTEWPVLGYLIRTDKGVEAAAKDDDARAELLRAGKDFGDHTHSAAPQHHVPTKGEEGR